jgi:signal transduction histidine kinase
VTRVTDLDALADGAVLAGPDRRVTAINRAAARSLGLTAAGAVGRPLEDVLGLRDQDGRDWYSLNCPYDGLPTRSAVPEQSWLLPDGTEVLVVARIHRPALHLPVERVAVSIRSGRGRARLDRERSDLVATVAHELRSPLTGVKGFVQALLNRWDKLSDEQKKLMLTTVSADSDRLSRLIAELLDVARIDTGRLQLYPRPSDAAVLVRRVVESVAAWSRTPCGTAPGRSGSRWARSGPARSTPACGSASRTRARASRPSCAGACSRSSGTAARAAAQGSGSTSSTAWSRRTAAP